MLTSDKNMIVEIFGAKYTKPIWEHLKEIEFKNARGEDFSRENIKTFINTPSRRNNKLEAAILKFAIDTQRQLNRQKKQLKKIVQKNQELSTNPE